MGSEQQGSLGRRDRRFFVLGTLALLSLAVLLAKYQTSDVETNRPSGPVAGMLVNVNTADEVSLSLLNQVGSEKARLIVEYRQSHGPFRGFSELMRVKGIGRKTVESLAGQVFFTETR